MRLWDMPTRRRITTLTGHTDDVTSLAFSPDGRTLTTGSGGTSPDGSTTGTTWQWDMTTPADLAGSACAMAGRTLTSQEWRQLIPSGLGYRKICP